MFGKTKRILVLLIVMVLILPILPITISAEVNEDYSTMEWDDSNSIWVVYKDYIPDDNIVFTPDDFPQVDCKRVCIVEKSTKDDGSINYVLVLVLNGQGEEAVKTAVANAKESGEFLKVFENDEFYWKIKEEVTINHQTYEMKVGEKVEIKVTGGKSDHYFGRKVGVEFTILPSMMGVNTITKDVFSKYGVEHFWPKSYVSKWDCYEFVTDNFALEGTKSEVNQYLAVVESGDQAIEIANALAKEKGCVNVNIEFGDAPVPLNDVWYSWNIVTDERWNVDIGRAPYTCPSLERDNVNVTMYRPGIYKLVVKRNNNFLLAYNECVVTVYSNGDVDSNNTTDSTDALLTLQASVEKIALTENEKLFADMDIDGVVDASDALAILQYSVGKTI